MKKTAFFIFVTIIVLALAGCSSTSSTQSSKLASNLPVITVVNNTGYTLIHLMISPTSFDYYEEVVFDKDVIKTSEGILVTLAYPLSQENRYDFAMIDIDGDVYEKTDVLLTGDDIIIFTFDDFVRE